MAPNLLKAIILPVFTFYCVQNNAKIKAVPTHVSINPYARISAIPVPAGFERTVVHKNSFAEWIRNCALRKNSTVYLFNGKPKKNQEAQFAVLDLAIGHLDLQQCADVVMRLRASYLYSLPGTRSIQFRDNQQHPYTINLPADSIAFNRFLTQVFIHCGTASLEKELHSLASADALNIGDVLIQGGFPGHAMLVADMAVNCRGKKIFLLLQGYMPAQDIHIVKNPGNGYLNPWYQLDDSSVITPEYSFLPGHFKTWQK